MTDFGIPLYEVQERDIKRKRLPFRIMTIAFVMGILLVDSLIIFSGFQDISSGKGGWLGVIGLVILVTVVFSYGAYGSYRLSFIYNRFGIYENGIAPPKKPVDVFSLRMPLKRNLFIPYSEIENVRLEGVWKRTPPKTPYVFTLVTRSQQEVDVHMMDIVEYTGMNLKDLRRIYEILCKVKTELNRDENKGKMDGDEPVILGESVFDETLMK